MQNISQSLAGRVRLTSLLPFSLAELTRRCAPAMDELLTGGSRDPAPAGAWTDHAVRGFYPRIHDPGTHHRGLLVGSVASTLCLSTGRTSRCGQRPATIRRPGCRVENARRVFDREAGFRQDSRKQRAQVAVREENHGQAAWSYTIAASTCSVVSL